jgi:hypothetical protein
MRKQRADFPLQCFIASAGSPQKRIAICRDAVQRDCSSLSTCLQRSGSMVSPAQAIAFNVQGGPIVPSQLFQRERVTGKAIVLVDLSRPTLAPTAQAIRYEHWILG